MVRTQDEQDPVNGFSETQGRSQVALLGFLSAALLGVAALEVGRLGDPLPLLTLLVAAILMEVCSALVPGFGYVSLSFFVCLAAVLRPTPLYGEALPSYERFGLPVVSQAILIAFCALVLGWLFRLLVRRDSHSGWRRLAEFFVHLLRVGLLGLVWLNIPGMLAPSLEWQTSLRLVSWSALAGVLGVALLHWLVDRLVLGRLVQALGEKGEHEAWLAHHSRIGWVHSLALVLAAWMAVVAAQGLFPQVRGLGPILPLGLGLLTSAIPLLLINRLAAASNPEEDESETEILEAALRGARFQLEAAKAREDAVSRELQKRADDMQLLYKMALDLGAATSLPDTLDIVLGMFRVMGLPFQSCVVFVLQEGQALPARSVTPFQEVLEMAHLLQLQEPAVREALRTGRPQLNEASGSPSEQRIFKDEQSFMCAPLIVNKEPIGAIYVGALAPGTYTEDHLNTLTMLAAHAAPSIHAVRLFESKQKDLEEERRVRTQVEAQKNQLEGLQNMVQSIGRELRQEHSLGVILGAVTELVAEAQSAIILLEEKTDEREVKPEPERVFVPADFRSPYKDFVKDMVVRPGEGFLGQVLQHRSRLVVDDFQEYSHANLLANERSAIAAPLVAEDDLLGCLYVGSPEKHAFTEADGNLIQTIASQAALALKNARLMDQTRQQALTDGLTGLYTHRFFKEQLKLQVDDARQSGKPACLILLDTDKFKQYNDTMGHPAGDALLKEIASILRESVRSSDIVCRQGGDEFAIVMRDSTKQCAVEVAQRIRETFELRFAEREVRVTASLGVCCFPTDALGFSDLVQHADEALYNAKNSGRNRVCVAPTLAEARRSS